MALKITQIKISEITPYWRNPRINDGVVKQVEKSIERYGFCVPILVDKERVIIAGHSRYRAMLNRKAMTIPAIVSDMDPDKAKEFRIADNEIPRSGAFDPDKLMAELKELADPSARGVPHSTGYRRSSRSGDGHHD